MLDPEEFCLYDRDLIKRALASTPSSKRDKADIIEGRTIAAVLTYRKLYVYRFVKLKEIFAHMKEQL